MATKSYLLPLLVSVLKDGLDDGRPPAVPTCPRRPFLDGFRHWTVQDGFKTEKFGFRRFQYGLDVMDIDSVGTFTMCHEALQYLKKGGPGKHSSEGGGLIVNISATLHYGASWYQIHVSAAKAAVDATTRNLALEWGTDYDIRVNGIAPGPIGDTPGMSKLAPEDIEGISREQRPLFKIGEKWDIAMASLYLASDAGKFVNGMTLVVDGGQWLSQPRLVQKDVIKQISRVVEKRSRESQIGLPKSKL